MRHIRAIVWSSLVLALAVIVSGGHAGILDNVKKKITDKSTKKAEDTVNKTVDQTGKSTENKTEGASTEKEKSTDAGKAGSGKFSSISTKFDYVPGDKIMLMDDFTLDELGEFPTRWRLKQGNYEIVDAEGMRWLRCTSPDGRVRMKAAGSGPLPEFWTLEFDLVMGGPTPGSMSIRGLKNEDTQCWEVVFPQGNDMVFRSGDLFSSTPLDDAEGVTGQHHIMIMARGNGLKAYIDRQRLVNVPEIPAASGMPTDIEMRMFSPTEPMIANVRFAEGCRPPKDMLAEGKLVTYGIYFDSGSDVVLPESAPVLRQIAGYMETNADVKLMITGHTDNVGAAASNLDLSKRRAASVAKVLSEQFSVNGDRFETDGKGDTQAVTSNAKPEGRAMNRRVEFAKL
jgi:OmpA-OmpF porin, OOP family